MTTVRTRIYIDGYNFYHACCKNSKHKWVNPKTVAEILLPGHKIDRVYFFTAAVIPQPHDPSKRQRQYVYWRALKTVPEITIVEGKFLELPKRLPWAAPLWLRNLKKWCCKYPRLRRYMHPILVKVWKTEEKGSDVNLATQLLLDAVDDAFDCAVVISNDSDLTTPICVVKKRFKKKIGILCGHDHPSRALQKEIHFIKVIRDGVLAASQFPPNLADSLGPFHKPPTW